MNNFQKLILYILTSFDRIKFSVPMRYYDKVLSCMDMFCNFETRYDDEDKYGKKYWKEIYYYGETRIVIRNLINNPARFHLQRFNVILSDPILEDQDFLRFVFSTIKQENPNEFYSILLSNFEIAYDFYPTLGTDVDDIKVFFDKHLYVRYSRSNTYFTFKTTTYTGRNGNVGMGAKGTRAYPKFEHGKPFFRFELQFNQDYNREHGITYETFPIFTSDFRLFDFIDFRDTLPRKAVHSIAATILRNKNIRPSSPGYRVQHQKMVYEVQHAIVRGSRGPEKAVHVQVDNIKELKKKYDISINHMKHFPILEDEKLLTSYLVAVEENDRVFSSKRIVHCSVGVQ